MTAADAMALHGDYVSEVTRLADHHIDVLFAMVTAAAARVSTAARPIGVTCAGRSLTASVGAQEAVFHVDVITDKPDDLSCVKNYVVGQALCRLPSIGDPAPAWVLVLQRTLAGNSGAGAAHLWMDEGARQPLTESMVARTLQAIFA